MKLKVLFLLSFWLFATHAAFNNTQFIEKWAAFKQKYSQLLHPKEESLRKAIFQKRLQSIEEHNERFRKGLETYKLTVNRFADFTDKELLNYISGLRLALKNIMSPSFISANSSRVARNEIPTSFDWRERGKVTPVKNQGQCGSCWAFSVTGAIEAQYKIRYGETVILSEQQLVDCAKKYGCMGCNGCWMDKAYTYIINNGGINYDVDYPYQASESNCRYSMLKPKVVVNSFRNLLPDEEELRYHVATYGPVTVAIHINDDFYYYSGGVYYSYPCFNIFRNHAVLVVGYGSENGQDYWIVKNSWGADWGIDGYIKIARNRNNHCGIASRAMIPIL